jgi:hypothetical protein
MVESAALAETTVLEDKSVSGNAILSRNIPDLLSDGSKPTRFPTFVNRIAYPVNTGVTADLSSDQRGTNPDNQ